MKVKEGSRSITRAWEFKANLNNVETLKREGERELWGKEERERRGRREKEGEQSADTKFGRIK